MIDVFDNASQLPVAEQLSYLNKAAEVFFQTNLIAADSICSKALLIASEINNEELVAQSH